MNWLTLWFALQIGVSPSSGIVTYAPWFEDKPALSGYAELSTELRFFDNHLFLGGLVRTESDLFKGDISFTPVLASYGFSGGLRWGGVEIGTLFSCQHPVVPYYSSRQPIINWDGWYYQAYIRFQGDAHLF